MRSLLCLIILVLLVTACQKPEEILPIPPPAERPATEAPSENSDKETQVPVDIDSESFQSAVFNGLPYRILVPRNYDPNRSYPMLVFLHGMGERGSDNERQLSIGASHFLADSIRERYPFFVIYPQCPESDYWFDDRIVKRVKELIDTLQGQYAVDKNKISIGGFSMGAYGTFEIASRYPGFFEAAFAISGDGDETKASLMAKSRWRIFAGKDDDVVASYKSEKMARALEKAGASVSFTLYPGASHGRMWTHAFSEPDLFDWLYQGKNPSIAQGLPN